MTVRSSVRVKVLMAAQLLPATSSAGGGAALSNAGLPFHPGSVEGLDIPSGHSPFFLL
ncbi:hypothetical protein E2C01_092260 [Portunus trituberculatus]|uniref:Uncharacterized protein n=1 Tax=Portunus trituberculatus TaxID=210409 RepID=A0A5B7JQX3_PORTR|nr:hypothetical protein [Portunus trituberculatus]